MTQSPEICPTCRQPKEPKASGRLTQWIVACNCGAPPIDAAAEQGPTISICTICKKRIEKGRPGSFTQWVFRVDICDCERPQAVEILASSAEAAQYGVPQVVEFEEDPDPLPLPPDKFPVDRYRPLQELGGGTAGAVYLCRDLVLNKRVAVKTLRRLTPDQLVAFQQEAKASSRLSHPGIVQVLDFGATESGDPFMVMEYFDGISLDKFLEQNGRLSPAAVINIMQRLCGGLTVAHDNGVLHRDLKPSNVLVKDLGDNRFEACLIDFGLARMTSTEQETTLFQGTSLVGSPFYMSPDQAAKLPYDARCEIYSLGCVMFELLTGRPPFMGETALNTLYMHVNEAPPMLSDVVEESFPDYLEQVVARCLNKDPDKRYQSAAELANELAPGTVTQTGIYAVPREADKARLALPFILAVVAILALFAGVLNFVLHPSKTSEKVAVKKFKHSKAERESKKQAKIDAEQMSHAMTGFATVGAEEDTFFGTADCRTDIEDLVKQGKSYRNLVFHKAILDDHDLENIAKLTPWTITMDGCSHMTDKSFKMISEMKRIDRLTLDEATQLTPQGLSALKNLSRLEYLCIRKSGLTDAHVKVISTFTEALHKVNISNNPKITSTGVEYLKNRKLPMEVVAEGCAVLLPAVALEKLRAKNNLTVLLEDKDTFDFDIFAEGFDEKNWSEDGDLAPPPAPAVKAD